MVTDLILIGAGKHSKVVIDIIEGFLDLRVMGYLDDNVEIQGKKINGYSVLGRGTELARYKKRAKFFFGFSNLAGLRKRQALFEELSRNGVEFVNIIHPTTTISRKAELGKGIFIGPGAIVNAGARIYDNVTIYSGAIIEHDNEIGAGSHISPNVSLSGSVRIGRTCFLGAGCSINNDVVVEDNAIVGMGAVVLTDVKAGFTVVGNPAKEIKQK